eukprot:6183573-Pyramimonas_sp.AAC.1
MPPACLPPPPRASPWSARREHSRRNCRRGRGGPEACSSSTAPTAPRTSVARQSRQALIKTLHH